MPTTSRTATTSTALAADVAALLPKRHGPGWAVSTTVCTGNPGSPAVLLSDGLRCFRLLVTDSGTTLTPPPHLSDASFIVPGNAPSAVTGAVLRSLLPRIDRDTIPLLPPQEQQHRFPHLAEIGDLLHELGTSADRFDRPDDTTGLSWQCGNMSVSFTLRGTSATGSVSFRGGLGTLGPCLAPFLPPHPEPGRVCASPPRSCGGVARRIVAAFPHAVEADEDGLVRFADADGGPLQGWVMPRDVNSPAGPTTPVTAGICGVGVDLMLSALPTIA